MAFNSNASSWSFPSGHTASIFAISTVLAKQFDHQLIRFGAYFFAGSVAFQRLLVRKHWASDVIVGAAIGYLVGNTVVNKYQSKKNQQLEVKPFLAFNRFGLSLNF